MIHSWKINLVFQHWPPTKDMMTQNMFRIIIIYIDVVFHLKAINILCENFYHYLKWLKLLPKPCQSTLSCSKIYHEHQRSFYTFLYFYCSDIKNSCFDTFPILCNLLKCFTTNVGKTWKYAIRATRLSMINTYLHECNNNYIIYSKNVPTAVS